MTRLRLSTQVAWCLVPLLACARRPPDNDPLDSTAGAGSSGTGNTRVHDAAVPRDRSIGDVSFTYDGPSDDGSVRPDAACAASAVPAQPVALDMYILLDRSASMQRPLNVVPTCVVGDAANSRWCHAIDALGGFFAASSSNGMGVALEFVPHGTCGWVNYPTEQNCCQLGECCAGAEHTVPAVALGQLPGNLPALVNALNVQDPLGTTTPLEAALRGMTQYARTAKRPDRQMVGIITTDGRPNGCERNTDTLAAILKQHRESTGQLTFVIGMTDADYAVLELLAKAGGAPPHSTHCAGGMNPCSFYDVGDGDPTAFVAALQQIQRSVVGCRFGIPTTDGGLVDPTTLIVQWSSPTHTATERIPRVDNPSASCQGWYADPSRPGEFALCTATCAQLQAQPSVQVDVLVGCLGS